MANKDMKMWHKRILFMISLPTEDYNENKELISDCISRLLEKGVDIRESIRREDLACINNYDIVIVVTHFDKDNGMLVLKDETMLISDFVNCLPENYDGYLDLSFCYSEVVKSAIKKRCPNYNPQVSEEETRLKVRLVAYPFVIDRIYENVGKDYHDIYMEVLNMLGEAATRNPENNQYDDDSLRLGQKRTSIFAPWSSKRGAQVPINVFIHYDSEAQVVCTKNPKGIEAHIPSEDLGDVNVGDHLTLTISFIEEYDSQDIRILGPKSKTITVNDDYSKESFIVKIGLTFNLPNFGLYIDVIKDNQLQPIKRYPIFIGVDDYESKTHTEIIPSNIEECDSKRTADGLLSGEEKMKRIIQAMKMVVEDDLILKKQDWAAIYRVLQEDNYYTLTIQSFVDIIKEQNFSKRIVPASDSNLRKVFYTFKKDKNDKDKYIYPNWKISSMNDDETSRLVHLAKTFMSYCKQ